MLAKVQPIFSKASDPTLLSFTAQFNPNPVSGTDQFTFTDENGYAVTNLFKIDGHTRISINLEGANFSGTGIDWALPPQGGEPLVTPNGNTRTFEVSPPTHALHPWAFGIVVDTPNVNGIRSRNIYLAKDAGSQSASLQLQYVPSTGAFNLLDDDSTTILVGSQAILVNATPPGEESVLTVDLEFLPPGSSIIFAENPVEWSSVTSPSWIHAVRSSSQPASMTLTIDPSGAGQTLGFRFAVKIAKDGGTPVTVLSPDPIIINATIGDG